MKLKRHAVLANLIPPLAEADEFRLELDIKKHGIRLPVLINSKNEIIDGHHRYEIAQKLGIECPVEKKDFDDEVEAGIALNLARRHLTNEQKLEIIRRCREELGWTQEKVAEIIGVHRSTVSKTEKEIISNVKIHKTYIPPDLRIKIKKDQRRKIFDEYKSGKTQEQIAANYGVAQPRIAQILKEKKEREEKEKERMKKFKEFEGAAEGFKLLKGDFREVLSDLKNIDAIITDPPYAEKYLYLFSELSKFAAEKLKPDGFIAVYSGQYHLPEVIKRLSEKLTYVWTFCLYHKGKSQIINNINIMCGWKPVLIFSRGNKKLTGYDVLISKEREKDLHEWQQSESGVRQLVEILSKPGDLIVDPFAGPGTFLKVAYELKRKAIGAEINDKA